MALSYQTAVSDGTMSLLDISIGYLERDDVTVYFDEVLTTAWMWSGVSDKRILFLAPVPNGVTVLVKRITDSDRLRHEFSQGAAFTSSTLDEDLLQNLYIAQEAQESNLNGDFFTDINLHGFGIKNLADAVDPGDAMNLGQYQSDIDGTFEAKEAAEAAQAAAEAAAASAGSAVTAFGARLAANGLPATDGAGMVGYNEALAYAAGTVGFAMNRKRMVVATGVASTDTAALNAAIVAAPARTILGLFGTFVTNAKVLLKPDIILEGNYTEVIGTNVNENVFELINPSPAGYPGRIGLRNMKITGQGNTGTSYGLYIDSNTPFIGVDNCFITSLKGGILLRDCYDSCISNSTIAVCSFGVSLFRESHAVKLDNNFVDGCSVAALAVNYGSGAGSGPTHNVSVIGGAYQNSPVGIWVEQTLGLHTLNVYHEGNSVHDYRIGVADAGVYGRACYNTSIDGFESASPCASGVNILIEHSVGVEINGAAWNNGCSTTATLARYDGFSDRVSLHMHRYSTLTPTATAPVDFTADPTRGVVWYRGRPLFGVGQVDSLRWGDLSNIRAWIGQTQPSSRNTLNMVSVLDALLKVGNAGIFRVQNTAGTDQFAVDLVNNKILITPVSIQCPNFPTSNPGAGSKVLWCDPADGNRVKFGV